MVDYTVFYKESSDPSAVIGDWDIFISAYNETDRVKHVFDATRATEKHWLIHAEYGFSDSEIPSGSNVYASPADVREDDYISGFAEARLARVADARLCVDISGFMRPHLMFLVRFLAARGVKRFDALYSEPRQYVRREATEFSCGQVNGVRPVAGLEGVHVPSLSSDQDVLIIGAGYEHELMRSVAMAKTNTRKFQLLGFPPLQADFYQENVLNARRAAEAVSAVNERHPFLAPANDPFVTASVIQHAVSEQVKRGAKNIYLCPLSSRPQALGFALYHVHEALGQPVSVIYPFAAKYARDSAVGIARVWRYTVELPEATTGG
jgi:hypothetical protein